jgi:hypothetical protein
MAASTLPTTNPFGMNTPAQASPYPAGQPMNPNQMPTMPAFDQGWNASDAAAPQLAGMLNGVNYNTQPLGYLQDYAESGSPSPWASAATSQSMQEQGQNLQANAGTAAGTEAQQEGNLALQGGLSSGARENIATGAQRSMLDTSQNIASQGTAQRMGITTQDASNKLGVAEALPGQETQAYQASLEPIQMYGQALSQDTANSMNEANAQNNFAMSETNLQGQLYDSTMQAEQQAMAAQQQAAKSGLFGMGGPLGLGFGPGGSVYNSGYNGGPSGWGNMNTTTPYGWNG